MIKEGNLQLRMIRQGTKPNKKNFSSWSITSQGLLFTFDPYKVAAYVFGTQHVLIPYAKLKPYFKSYVPIPHAN